MGRLLSRVRLSRVKVAIGISVPALVFLCHLVATAGHSSLEKIAAELVSAKEFFGAPGPNHAGTKLFFSQTSENGVKAYLVETATGKSKLLYEHEQSHLQGVGLLGWSPDDNLFAYSLRSPEGEVVICDGHSGSAVATVSESKIILEGVWLSNEVLVYLNKDQNFTVVRKLGGEWHKMKLFVRKPANQSDSGDRGNKAMNLTPGKQINNTIQHLTAISDTAIAWQQGGRIWNCEIGADTPTEVWDSTTNVLLDFYFSRPRQVFKLHCRDEGGGEFLATFYPAFNWHNERLTDFEKIDPNTTSTVIAELNFLQNEAGYVSLNHNPTFDEISGKTGGGQFSLKWDSIGAFALADSHIFISGSLTNGPLGIWDYDINSCSLNCAVPGLDRPFKYAMITTPVDKSIATISGRTINFRLWPPRGFIPGKKYPLVIGFSGRRWRGQEAAVPNSDSFLASLVGSASKDWPGDAIAVFHVMDQDASIDTNHVYLMGVSAGASVVGHLLEERPELWRGAILFSPVSFPRVFRVKASKILVDSGGNDTYLKNVGGINKLVEFQETAAKAGVPVILSVHTHASHVYRSTIAEEERIQQVLRFLDCD